MLKTFKRLLADESGDVLQTGIVMAMLAILAVGAFVFLGPKVKQLFNKTGGQIDEATNFSY